MSAATVFRALLAAFIGPLTAGCASVAAAESAEPIAIDGQAAALHGQRFLEVRVGIHIAASPETVWSLLTDASAYPSWNTTVTSIEGSIAKDQKIALRAKIDPKRTFKLRVSAFEPARKMVWEDGGKAFRGVRTFTLEATPDGTTNVTMREVLTGTMMAMIEPKLPDFRPSFTQFAADLKAAAESTR
jgi:uncharacterized protein YndB with AHSA1/START domain